MLQLILLHSGLVYAGVKSDALNAIRNGDCDEALRLTEPWELQPAKTWKQWEVRAQALECAKAPNDQIYNAYREYLWYGGKKTSQIQKRMKSMYASLFDLRVKIKVPNSTGKTNHSKVKLSVKGKKWARFKDKGNGLIAYNLIPGKTILQIQTDNTDLPSYEMILQTRANEEYVVTVNWPKTKLFVPINDPDIQATVKLPTKSTWQELNPGSTIDTIAGAIEIAPKTTGFKKKLEPYTAKLQKGSSLLPLPWGYKVIYNDKVIASDIFLPNEPAINRDDIKIPIASGINKLELSTTLRVTPKYGKIQRFVFRDSDIDLGEAFNRLRDARLQAQMTLKPQLISYGLAGALLVSAYYLEDTAQDRALVARNIVDPNMGDKFSDSVFQAQLYRTLALGAGIGGVVSAGVGFSMSIGPLTNAIKGYRAAKKELSTYENMVINLNEYNDLNGKRKPNKSQAPKKKTPTESETQSIWGEE